GSVRSRLRDAVAGADPAGPGGGAGAAALRAVLGHLAEWRRWQVAAIRAAATGEDPVLDGCPPRLPAGFGREPSYEARERMIQDAMALRSLGELARDLQEVLEAAGRWAAGCDDALWEAELPDPRPFGPPGPPRPLADLLAGWRGPLAHVEWHLDRLTDEPPPAPSGDDEDVWVVDRCPLQACPGLRQGSDPAGPAQGARAGEHWTGEHWTGEPWSVGAGQVGGGQVGGGRGCAGPAAAEGVEQPGEPDGLAVPLGPGAVLGGQRGDEQQPPPRLGPVRGPGRGGQCRQGGQGGVGVADLGEQAAAVQPQREPDGSGAVDDGVGDQFSHHEDDVVDVSGLGDAPSAQGPRGEPPRLRRGPRPGPQFPGRLRAAARAALARSGGRRGRSLSCSCAAAVGGVIRVVGGWCGRFVVPCVSHPRGVHVPVSSAVPVRAWWLGPAVVAGWVRPRRRSPWRWARPPVRRVGSHSG